MEEKLDIIDYKTGKPTGEVALRSEAHKKGLAHRAVHLWIVIEHEGQPHFVFQQRSLKKPNYPGIFVATVGGHVSAGEGKETLVRETAEEVGLALDLDRAVYLESHPFELHLPGYDDYEWIDEYLYIATEKLKDFSFADGEVIGLGLVTQKNLAALVKNPEGTIEGIHFDGSKVVDRTFSKTDFIPNFWEMHIATTLCELEL
ncbi:MAG: NUDIX domain-containing protein [SAR324 cluster bacterium]|nr:NUDIX domain-containing protein [SAR324 cluster bacterium]